MEHYYSKKKYSRNISNIRRWRGPLPSGPPRASPPGTHEVVMDELMDGDLLAVTEDEEKDRLGMITSIVNDTLTLTMYGTTNPNINGARFFPVYQLPSGQIHCNKRKPRDKQAIQWTWEVCTSEEQMIKAVGLTLNKHGQPNATSLRALKRLAPLTHHAYK